MEKEYKFSADELESQIKTLSQKGITELYVCDNLISSDKKRILTLLTKISEYAPEVFVSFLTKANIIVIISTSKYKDAMIETSSHRGVF